MEEGTNIATIITIVGMVSSLLGIGVYLVRVTKVIAQKADDHSVSNKFRDMYLRVDDIKDKYVRRDDLSDHLKHVQDSVDRIERNQEEMSKQVTKVLERRGS